MTLALFTSYTAARYWKTPVNTIAVGRVLPHAPPINPLRDLLIF